MKRLRKQRNGLRVEHLTGDLLEDCTRHFHEIFADWLRQMAAFVC